jgi:putative ABC transport system permease protein
VDLKWASARDLRQLSLTIFDRSFAMTYVLEAVALLVAQLEV